MNDTPLIEEPLFITDAIEAEMIKAGHVFEPPKHVSTGRLYELPGFEYLRYSDEKPSDMTTPAGHTEQKS
ncbi:hypothetical protein CW360_15885 [Pseudomonas fluvialis]|uniref:Uncharacterized protein n=1 Tax=Pseudomonas fluvialis TaxID=1793966 RepID=A0A2I0CLE2_9PSED|nr:hypothetical protein [Pseudomonas pharmacofabricae]PKF69986.1 hypothetical protein CW360_15885 [Pseudomonas pharmacofabricae]